LSGGPGKTRYWRTWKRVHAGLFTFFLLLLFAAKPVSEAAVINDSNSLALPAIGDHGLRVISPTILELTLINTKQLDPARVTTWDFVDNQFVATLPALTQFQVLVNGQLAVVQSVGFKRRPLHAPEVPGGLRIANHLYLKLLTPIADGATVEVKNPTSALWVSSMQFTAKAESMRRSPAVHVNQVGYMPNYPKKAMVGFYLGSMGELPINAASGFQLSENYRLPRSRPGQPRVGAPASPTPASRRSSRPC
jgi:hypothetical protein